MIALLRNTVGLAILTTSLAFSIPCSAQNQNNDPSSPLMNSENPGVGVGDMPNGFERQDIREEREQIRKEHEDLEAARDKLREECTNAQGPQVQSCEQQREALRDEHDKLHERIHAFHEKMEQIRQTRGEGPDNGGQHPQPSAPAVPNNSPPPPSR